MPVKIDQKIVGYFVVKPNDGKPEPVKPLLQERPAVLPGCTYKIKTPLSEHALYVTITDIVLNPGTPDETRRPVEMFISSKAMEHFQWIVALTRVISAVFRYGGEVAFLVEELRSVFDPKGGYFKKGGKYCPSLVAEIGDVLEQHLTTLNLFQRDDSLVVAAQAMIADKLHDAENPKGSLCVKCGEMAVVILDGCSTCVNCGDSKCS